MRRALLAAALLMLTVTALSAEMRKWTSKDGRFSTEAELVEADETSVTLKKPSGETISVPLERLSDADRRFLRAETKKASAPKTPPAKTPAAKPVAAAAAKPPATKPAPPAKKSLLSYTQDIQPILTQYCADCHGPGGAKQGYDVTSYPKLLKPGVYGPLVVPGDTDKSRLVEVVRGMSKSMPPRSSPQPTPEEIAKLAEWVEAGAKDDSGSADKPGRGGGAARSSRRGS